MERKPTQPAQSFEDLIVWQKAHAWVLGVYRISANFPKHELFGLTSQLRRAAVSVPGNIAEAFARRTKPDKVRIFNIARASLAEARYYLLLTHDLRYANPTELLPQCDEIGRMLDAYIRSLCAAPQR
jgi:four helix bundle protein